MMRQKDFKYSCLHRSNLKEYINREKIWTMKQMGGNALKAKNQDGNGQVGDISFSLKNISSYFQRAGEKLLILGSWWAQLECNF